MTEIEQKVGDLKVGESHRVVANHLHQEKKWSRNDHRPGPTITAFTF
jgi:hypothetical protein